MPPPGLARPRRSRGSFFALTPLIDVMFLLLIFFMLSSQIAPYSLLPVRSATVAGTERPPAEASPAGPSAVVRVDRDRVTLDGAPLAAAQLREAFGRSVAAGRGDFLVLPSRTASVQDLVTVLEALKAASAGNVTLVGGTGGSP